MGYNNLHKFNKVFKMQEVPMTDAEIRAKYDRTAPKPQLVDDSSSNATPAVMPKPVKKQTNFSKILNTVAKAVAAPPALKVLSLGAKAVSTAISAYKNKK